MGQSLSGEMDPPPGPSNPIKGEEGARSWCDRPPPTRPRKEVGSEWEQASTLGRTKQAFCSPTAPGSDPFPGRRAALLRERFVQENPQLQEIFPNDF